jgi:hypothetical protein
MFSRRDMLAMSAAGAVMTANAARAASSAIRTCRRGALSTPRSGNLGKSQGSRPAIGSQFPSAQFPPATDVGGMPMDWTSFNNARKRVQGLRMHDGVQYRPECDGDRFQYRRYRLRQEKSGRYVANVGGNGLQFIGIFSAFHYEEISLSSGLTHTPPALVTQHLNVDQAIMAKWPDDTPA